MSPTSIQTTTQSSEANALHQLEAQLRDIQAERERVQAELEGVEARIFADELHLCTIIFRGGQMILVEVRGAPNQDRAHSVVCTAFLNCEYIVLDGNQTNGRAVGDCRCWYSSAAQERYRDVI